MSADAFLDACVALSLALMALAFALTVARLTLGPTLPDRVLALDMLTSLGIGFIAAIGIRTGYPLVVDIALALGLVGFLATVAFARFVLAHGDDRDEER